MRPASQPIWALISASAHLGAVARAAGVLDIGLVFPRTNETYEISDELRIVFAVQNPKVAEHLKPYISYEILNMTADTTEDIEIIVGGTWDIDWNSTKENDPYLLWSRLIVEGEGKLRVMWRPHWRGCNETRDKIEIDLNQPPENFLVDFEIKAGGQKPDLVAATGGNAENCPNGGVAIEVTDKTLEGHFRYKGLDTCAVLGPPSSMPTSNPCKVKIDKAAVESMQAVSLEKRCRGLDKPDECPKDEEDLAHPRLIPAGVAGLAAVLGASLFLA